MKILVYGVGFLGSYLAYALHRGGNDVTLLEQGKRLSELKEKGLVIRHYIQHRTTVDFPAITDRFRSENAYDIVFVVMRSSQLDNILAELCENKASTFFVLVGNNATAEQTQKYIDKHAVLPKKIVFGFQMVGGRCEDGKTISIYWGFSKLTGRITLGSLKGDDSYKPLIEQAFSKTHYRIEYSRNMDAWLKYHAAFMVPVGLACCHSGCSLKKIAGDKTLLNRIVDAIGEAYRILDTCCYPAEPKQNGKLVRWYRFKRCMTLKLMCSTALGRLASSCFETSARDETQRLYDDFSMLKAKTDIATPVWDELARCMER